VKHNWLFSTKKGKIMEDNAPSQAMKHVLGVLVNFVQKTWRELIDKSTGMHAAEISEVEQPL
jgi:hypothetical protein